jgi:hypothetical protein
MRHSSCPPAGGDGGSMDGLDVIEVDIAVGP